MISKVQQSLVYITIILTVIACQNQGSSPSSEPRKFLNIDQANEDISESIGIDILQYKSTIDKVFTSDSFYVELSENILFNTGQSDIYMKFGPKMQFDDGDSIKLDQQDTLFVRIFQSLADNIYLADCSPSFSDTSFCVTKKRIYDSYKAVNGVVQLAPSTSFGHLYDLFRTGNLNYEEFAFMCVVHHVIRDIYYLDM